MPMKVSIYPIKSGLGLRICQAWKPLIYIPKGIYHPSQCLDKQSWCLHKGEVLATFNKAFIYIATKKCSRIVYSTTRQVDDLQKS